MNLPAVECGNPHVADLLAFTIARAEEDWPRSLQAPAVDEARRDLCELVEQALEVASEVCCAEKPCELSERPLRVLAEYAAIYESHPSFHPAWLSWR